MKLDLKRRDLDYFVIILLIGSSLYVFGTGLIADTMGLHHFGFHSQVGYFWMMLAVIHLAQTWFRVKAFVKQRLQSTSPSSSAIASRDRAETITQPYLTSSRRRTFLFLILALGTGIGLHHFLTSESSERSEGESQDWGVRYHEWSKPGYGEVLGTLLNWGKQPPLYKRYPEAEQIVLPSLTTASSTSLSLETTLLTRRSWRNYLDRPLALEQLAQLLRLAQSISEPRRGFRTVPSAGALYPLETYAIVHRVEGLAPGIYHHGVEKQTLAKLQTGDFRQPLIQAGLNQAFLGECAVCFVISGVFQRTRWKYHERTYRYILMEVGHLGENFYLIATSMGLGVCGIGAFFDDPLNQLLGLDGVTEAAFYLMTVGEV